MYEIYSNIEIKNHIFNKENIYVNYIVKYFYVF